MTLCLKSTNCLLYRCLSGKILTRLLHLYIQIVGKIRLMLAPRKNHWWYITLYVSPKGFTTHAIPYGNESFEITFNAHTHQLELTTSQGASEAFALHDGLSVADFYQQLMRLFRRTGHPGKHRRPSL